MSSPSPAIDPSHTMESTSSSTEDPLDSYTYGSRRRTCSHLPPENSIKRSPASSSRKPCPKKIDTKKQKQQQQQSSCVSKIGYMSKHPLILLASLLVFGALTATAVILTKLSCESQDEEAYDRALQVAEESADKLTQALTMTFLPLFSMAQFATNLDIFNDLPGMIGQANEPGSLPYLEEDDGSLYYAAKRNITGVCDNPELIVKFNEICTTIKKNVGMEAVLSTIQLAPFGVSCVGQTSIALDLRSNVRGLDFLHHPVLEYRQNALNAIKGEGLEVIGPLLLDLCPQCGRHMVARLSIPSDKWDIEVEGEHYPRWGFIQASLNWAEMVKKFGIDHITEPGLEIQISMVKTVFNTGTDGFNGLNNNNSSNDDYIGGSGGENHVVLAESPGFGSKAKEVSCVHEADLNEYLITVQYDVDNSQRAWLLAISVVMPFLLACLLYVVLLQNQFRMTMQSTAMAQEAKVGIERNMSAYFAHELRNPLGAIDSALALLPDCGELSEEARELVSGMTLCSSFMSTIMNNLLDVRKIEEGKMELRMNPFSLELLLHDVRKMTLPSVRPGVAMHVVVTEDTQGRDFVLGDSHRIQQILNNLVTNAIKYTVSGSITLVAGWQGDQVRLLVRDTGPGIPKKEQENLFERFVMRGGAPGSGLGLAIAKQIVDLMHGSIRFESDPSVKPGTTAIVLLPLQCCDEPSSKELEQQAKSSMLEKEEEGPIEEAFSMLIVDDIKMNRSMLQKRILKGIAPNCTVSQAATGEQSLEMCQTETYDVIVMDQFMEEAGGIMVGTDAIAALRRAGNDSYIIGCSGNDMEASFRAADADLVWGKPLPTNQQIIRQLRSGLHQKRGGSKSLMPMKNNGPVIHHVQQTTEQDEWGNEIVEA